eukprot:1301418-Prymnesium_polylepis.1
MDSASIVHGLLNDPSTGASTSALLFGANISTYGCARAWPQSAVVTPFAAAVTSAGDGDGGESSDGERRSMQAASSEPFVDVAPFS